jgi:subtilisin family serine protease
MSYRVFYASANGNESFFTTEGIAALEDIVKDGADVVNNSWGEGPTAVGGEFDPLDQALINASHAGVFVSLSGGNSGPGGGTMDHPSSEYIDVAASTTTGTLASGRLNISAPQPISDTLQNLPFGIAEFGAPLPQAQVISHPFVTAQSVDPANVEGCNAWPAGTFAGKAAVISRGTCDFSVKVLNAQQAGATFVVIYNHAAGGEGILNMANGQGAEQVTISSIFVQHSAGLGMLAWFSQHGAASTLAVNTFAFQLGNQADRIIDFSSRGPGVGNVLKPDIAAPGVNILSQGYAPGVTGEARHLGFGQVSGTSMASPHVAGAAALLRQAHPTWSNAYIKSALMSTSKYLNVYNFDETPAQPLDMGAGRLDLAKAASPGVILDPPSLSFGLVPTGTLKTIQVSLISVASQAETYNVSTLYTGGGFTQTTTLPGFSVSPASVTLAPGARATLTVTFNSAASQGIGDNQGYIVLDGATYDAHLPAWARVTHASPLADVLLIDNDGSSSLGSPNYTPYYTSTLNTLGYSYDIVDTDLAAGAAATFLPDPTTLFGYRAIIYFTGDNFEPNGTYTVPTPLTQVDMDRLTEYANNGGLLIAMGQDLAGVLGAAEHITSTNSGSSVFLYNVLLGANWLQDSVSDNAPPVLPVVPTSGAPRAFHGVILDLTDRTTSGGDGAGNQAFIDEIQPEPPKTDVGDPNMPEELEPYVGLLKYPGFSNIEDGVVATAHRDQPSLENPGIAFYGRSVYTSFGLEGVNNTSGLTSRGELLQKFFDWGWDAPTATISNTTPVNASLLRTFEVKLTSPISGTAGVSYRWDFGDGSPYAGPYATIQASHTYPTCGLYIVRVEATDTYGNRAIGSLRLNVQSSCKAKLYLAFARH